MFVMTHQGAAPKASTALRAGVFAFAVLALAGCTDRLATGTVVADDYKQRHPIVLGERPVAINLFPASKLDAGARRRLAQFAADAGEHGMGRIDILVPAGAMNEAQARAFLPEVRAALTEGGAVSSVNVGSYPSAHPRAAQPLRISYRTLRAAVATRCGQWPVDMASGSSLETWENQTYWNFGCSYQNMLATQVDDPRDFETPRANTPADLRNRLRAIEKVRQGADPNATWSTPNVGIGTVGGK